MITASLAYIDMTIPFLLCNLLEHLQDTHAQTLQQVLQNSLMFL